MISSTVFVIFGTSVAVLAVFITVDADSEKWSPTQDESDFEPSVSVLEQWSELSAPEVYQLEEDMFRTTSIDREDKVMKKPANPDRIVNKPPKKPSQAQDVSETDLFLLGAIEKLAYRMDFLEKRTKRVEEMLYQLLAGSSTTDGEPCPDEFTRQNGNCYHVSNKLLNWKSASSMCRSMGGVLLELHAEDEKIKFIASLQSNLETQGNDFWTGGLNPGLLWLWGTSAKPVSTNSTHSDVVGSGRCLLLGFSPPTRSYHYKGADCAARHRYVCQMEDNTTERRLKRLLRDRKIEIQEE